MAAIKTGYEISVRGLVQGVGFRPFICRLAFSHNLFGEVINRTDGVTVIIKCDRKSAELFVSDIRSKAPPAANIKSIEIKRKMIAGYSTFSITASKDTDASITEVSPDIAVCTECLADLDSDPERIDYPFVNCTNCGPRFTIIKALPYDRDNTTMDHSECVSGVHQSTMTSLTGGSTPSLWHATAAVLSISCMKMGIG